MTALAVLLGGLCLLGVFKLLRPNDAQIVRINRRWWKVVAMAFVIALCGCEPMTREQVIRACADCEKAGMRPEILRTRYQEIVGVECWPKESAQP